MLLREKKESAQQRVGWQGLQGLQIIIYELQCFNMPTPVESPGPLWRRRFLVYKNIHIIWK